jgi:PAS domain S-box-containing protein
MGLSNTLPWHFYLSERSGLIWLDALSNLLTCLAYAAVTLSLVKLARGRTDVPTGWLLWFVIAFVLAYASLHALSVLRLWVPDYLAADLVKLLTAGLAVATALSLRPLVRAFIALPSRMEMERLNRALHKKTTALLLAQEAGRIGSWSLDIHSDIVEWSTTQFQLYGLQADSGPMRREAWLALVESSDREVIETGLAAALQKGSAYQAQFRIVHPDGSRRWLAERGRVIADRMNAGQQIVGVTIDVTEQNRLTEDLAASNELLSARAAACAYAGELAAEQMRVMFEHSPDAQFILRVEQNGIDDPQFMFEAVNPANERLTGQNAAVFIGHRPEQCHSADESKTLNAQYCRCLQREGVTTFVMRRNVFGRQREFETSLSPVRDPRSSLVTHIIGISRDVTERNALEHQLRHVAKMEATSRLTAGIAHDFNNMLQGLMGGLEMLQLEINEPSLREYADIALNAARRGADLTHRLLAFSRQQALQSRPVDAISLLNGVARLLEPTLSHGCRLIVIPPVQPVVILADPEQLEAAVVSLVVNAADAMPQGGRIEMSATLATHVGGLDLGTGPFAIISVHDEGMGMEPAVQAQACDPFFTTKGLNGSGLGLSMVQGFARQSGGDLCFESTVGVGTCAQIWLPLAAEPIAIPTKTSGAAAHLLLVDDAADVLVTVGAFLRHAGFEVTRVSSGEQALAHVLSGARCDAIVTDFAMPNLNGIDLLKELREVRPGLPGLIITGFDGMATRAHEIGVRVLHKPFVRRILLDEVQYMLSHSAATSYATPPPTGMMSAISP